jgi:type VI secretion system protein VasD
MAHPSSSFRIVAALGFGLMLSSAGCALFRSGEAKQEPVQLRVVSVARLNPDELGVPLPTSIRVYQLASASKFNSLELTDLLGDPKARLGPDLLGIEELQLEPGGVADLSFTREKGTRFLGVVAIVRRPAGTGWRQVVELPDRSAKFAFEVEEYRIQRR